MMNDIREISPIAQDQLQKGVSVLEQRRNRLRAYTSLSGLIVVLTIFGLVFHQSLIYAYFDISTTVQQLHIPVSALEIESVIGQQADYFGRLLNWVMWLGLKVFVALIGASLFVYLGKKVAFFKRRMHNFGTSLLGWIVAFMLIWTGMTFAQSEINENGQLSEEYAEFIAYDRNIEKSDIYHYVQRSYFDKPVKDYLLAQTALLHQPADQDVALAYTSQLIEAEQKDKNFLTYGFKPQQLWAIQYQLYGKAVTPLAQTVDKKIVLADQISQYVQWVLWFGLSLFFVFLLIFYGLVRQFNTRLSRIQHQLNE